MRDETILKLFSPGSWIRMPLALLHRLTSNEVIVLAEIINQSVVSNKDEFFYSVEDFQDRTGFNADAQKRCLRRLSDLRIVRLGKAGLPARRTIAIVWESIAELLSDPQLLQGTDPQLLQGTDPQLLQGTDPQLLQGTVRADSHSPVSANPPGHTVLQKKHTKKPLTGFQFGDQSENSKDAFDELAEMMYDTLSRKRKIFRQPNLKSWAKTFREFSEKSKFTVEEISSTLSDFLEMLDAEFAPLAFSAEAFTAKWNNIRAFIDRSKKKASSAWDSI